MEIRKLVGDELHEGDLLWVQCFDRGNLGSLDGLKRWREGVEDRTARFGLWDEGGLQATLELVEIRFRFGPEVILKGSYISVVACRPERRGRGYGQAILSHALEYMRGVRQVITTLSPFEFGYYRPFGWEWVKVLRSYRATSRLLPHSEEAERVRPATAADRPNIIGAYERFSARYRGMSVRDEVEWERVIGNRPSQMSYTYLYEGSDGIEGYLVMRGGSGDEAYLPEFVSLTPRAQLGLLAFLGRMHMQSKAFVWDAPEDDGLWSQFMHRELRTTTGPGLQGRVVDVANALHELKPNRELDGGLILKIRDSFAPWNDGGWRVDISNGAVSASKTEEPGQVEMDIQAFSQAFFGALPLAELRNRQRIQVKDEIGYESLRQLLDGPPMWYCGPL